MGLRDEDRGFTLVELMVVVLVISILIAIAVPTFLGARQRAQDRAAQTLLRNGIVALQIHLDDHERTVPARATILAELPDIEPSIGWLDHLDDAQESAATVSIDSEPTFITAATGSSSGNCYYVRVYVDGTDDRHVDQTAPASPTTGRAPPLRPDGEPVRLTAPIST
jgi:type IV pilus assembly protein PilA